MCFKLADFGTSREMNEEHHEVMSYIQGTEEYISPNMFDLIADNIADARLSYDPMVADLWSMGVTLYEAATGRLPFRVTGGRHNRQIMKKMLQGLSGREISAHVDTYGAIIYEETLPDWCSLSRYLCDFLVQLIRGLFSTGDKKWSKDAVFDLVSDLKPFLPVYVFFTEECLTECIYVEPSQSLAYLHDKISCVFNNISHADQELLIEGRVLDNIATPNFLLMLLPETSPAKPITLMHKNLIQMCDAAVTDMENSMDALGNGLFISKSLVEALQNIHFPEVIHFDEDVQVAKQIISIMLLQQKTIMEWNTFDRCLDSTALSKWLCMSDEICHFSKLKEVYSVLMNETKTKLDNARQMIDISVSIPNTDQDKIRKLSQIIQQLQRQHERNTTTIHTISLSQPALDEVMAKLIEINNQHRLPDTQCVCGVELRAKLEVAEAVLADMRSGRQNRHSDKNAQQIQKVLRCRIKQMQSRASDLLKQCSEYMHKKHREIIYLLRKINDVMNCSKSIEKLRAVETDRHKTSEKCDEVMRNLLLTIQLAVVPRDVPRQDIQNGHDHPAAMGILPKVFKRLGMARYDRLHRAENQPAQRHSSCTETNNGQEVRSPAQTSQ